LVGAINDGKAALPDALADLVAADHRLAALRHSAPELARTDACVQVDGLG
jgi:hypothetical protein